MHQTARARTTTHATTGPIAVGLVVAIAGIICTILYRSASSTAALPVVSASPDAYVAGPRSASSSPPSLSDVLLGHLIGAATEVDGAVTEVDGVLPEGVTVFDDEYPGIAKLDPALRVALRKAAVAAAQDAVEIHVTSGWRSREYQNELLREAVATYGSTANAARWVATADTSPHVAGHAVDIGPSDAEAWLSHHGADFGLCQIYRNEAWHYELRPRAMGHGCPRMYADPTHDPRMQP